MIKAIVHKMKEVTKKNYTWEEVKGFLNVSSEGPLTGSQKASLISFLIIYMTKLLQSDWLRGVQLFH
jgi:hypothetical protein